MPCVAVAGGPVFSPCLTTTIGSGLGVLAVSVAAAVVSPAALPAEAATSLGERPAAEVTTRQDAGGVATAVCSAPALAVADII